MFLLHAYAYAGAAVAASSAQSNEYAAAGAFLTEEHIRSIQSFDPRQAAAAEAAAATAAAADRRLQQPSAKCRPLRIDEWLGLLQTEAGAENDLTEEVAGAAGVDPSLLLARAQLMWEDATGFEWARSAGAATGSSGDASSSTPAPFVVCHERTAPGRTGTGTGGGPVVSGFRRRRAVRDAIRAAINIVADRAGATPGLHRGVDLRTLHNGDDLLCSYALMDGAVARELFFDGCVVQPVTMSMKLMPRTVQLLLEKAGACREEIEGIGGIQEGRGTEIEGIEGLRGGLRGLRLAGSPAATRTRSSRPTTSSTGGDSAGIGSSADADADADADAADGIGDDQRQRRGQEKTVLDWLLCNGKDDCNVNGDDNGDDKDNDNDNDNGGSGSILDGLPDCNALDLDRPSADIILCPGSLSYNQLTALQAGDPSYIVASLTSKKADQSSSIPEQVYWTSSAAEPYRRMESARSEYWKRALAEAGSERCDEVFRTRLRWSVRPGSGSGNGSGDETGDFVALRVVYDAATAETWESACIGTLIAGLAVRQDVCGLELSADLGTNDFNANWLVQSGVEGETLLTDVGLDGADQVVALSDTGIDVRNCYFLDADFEKPTEDLDTNGHRKIAQYWAYADDTDEELGHGTHGK